MTYGLPFPAKLLVLLGPQVYSSSKFRYGPGHEDGYPLLNPLLLANGWSLPTSISDYHRLANRHAQRTKKARRNYCEPCVTCIQGFILTDCLFV